MASQKNRSPHGGKRVNAGRPALGPDKRVRVSITLPKGVADILSNSTIPVSELVENALVWYLSADTRR